MQPCSPPVQTTNNKVPWPYCFIYGDSSLSLEARWPRPTVGKSARVHALFTVVVNRTPLFPPERAGCLHARTGGKFFLHVVLLTQLNMAQMGISIQPVSKHVIVRKVSLVTASSVAAAHRGMTKHLFRVI